MILTVRSIEDISFLKLTELYEENIESNRIKYYNQIGFYEGRIRSENDLYQYVKDVFFKQSKGTYLIYQHHDKYVSGLRYEPYEDGVLINALMTAKDYRRKGFAFALMKHLTHSINEPIYSHIHLENIDSVRLHQSVGFEKLCDHSILLDGSFSNDHFTYIRRI